MKKCEICEIQFTQKKHEYCCSRCDKTKSASAIYIYNTSNYGNLDVVEGNTEEFF